MKSVLPLVFWIPSHHDKRSIQDWGISSIMVLKEESHCSDYNISVVLLS